MTKSGGGWPAIFYAWRMARRSGGVWRMWKALRAKNACKTCALGMGGQLGGMVNERGRFPEVCKKSIQAMAADMRGAIRDDFFEAFSLERLKALSPRELEASGRLIRPMCAGPGDTHYRPIDWDEALHRVVDKLKATDPREAFFYFSGRSSNEAGFLLQLFARLYGTNHVNNCSFYCHQASGVALSRALGSGTGTVELDDLNGCDLVFLIGANPASNHPRLMRVLLDLRRRRGKVIVVNPIREAGLVRFKVPSDPRSLLFGSTIADEYVQPHIGGDLAFLAGVAKAVLETGACDQRFIEQYTDGWPEFCSSIEAMSWNAIEAGSGVDRATIERVADLYGRSKSTVFCWTMGITHHRHGVENVHMIANLAFTRGMIGRPSAGLLPLRGHSNVQGMGSMGATPKLKDAVFHALQREFGVKLPEWPGLDTLACLERAEAGGFRFAWCLGGNLYGSNPDAEFAARALGNIDFAVYLSTALNTGHAHGRGRETLILPVRARDEEPQPTTQESMFSFVRLSEGGPARHEGPRSEVELIAAVAEQVLSRHDDGLPSRDRQGAYPPPSPIDWAAMRRHGRIREAISRIVPGYEALGAIDQTRKEFQIAGRTFHEPKFNTPTGRAGFKVCNIPPLVGESDGRLRLMTIRSEGQFNTVVYEDEDIYRGQERRDVILMHPSDMARLGLAVNQRVTVQSDAGVLSNVLVRELDIRPGNAAMYYPEANALVPRVADPASRTPAFKSVAVTVGPEPRPPELVELNRDRVPHPSGVGD